MRQGTLCLLIVFSAARLHAFWLLTYNVVGNGTTNWSTNAPQAPPGNFL